MQCYNLLFTGIYFVMNPVFMTVNEWRYLLLQQTNNNNNKNVEKSSTLSRCNTSFSVGPIIIYECHKLKGKKQENDFCVCEYDIEWVASRMKPILNRASATCVFVLFMYFMDATFSSQLNMKLNVWVVDRTRDTFSDCYSKNELPEKARHLSCNCCDSQTFSLSVISPKVCASWMAFSEGYVSMVTALGWATHVLLFSSATTIRPSMRLQRI